MVDDSAVPHHRHDIGDALQLAQPMGYVDGGDTMPVQVRDPGEHELGLALCEARRWFVEDEQLHALRHRAGNTDQLLLVRA
jgi:hypothetical protein